MLFKEVKKKMTSNIIERKRRIHVNMLIKEATKSMTSNIIEWKKRICVTDTNLYRIHSQPQKFRTKTWL